MDKIFQTAIACDSLYGLYALALICITLIVGLLIMTVVIIIGLFIVKAIVLGIIGTYDYFHAKFHGTSIQSEIDLRSKAA